MSLINNIGTPPNSPRKYALSIADLGGNIDITNEATPKMAPVIMSNKMTAKLLDERKMETSHVGTLQLLGLAKKS